MFKYLVFFAVLACIAAFAVANPEPKPQVLLGGYGYAGVPVATTYGAYGAYPALATYYR